MIMYLSTNLNFIILANCILSLYVEKTISKYVEGHLIVAEKWYFVARFCFLSEHGQFEYFIEYTKEYAVQNLLLYYDTEDQWPTVYKTETSCEEKESILNVNQNQIISLSETEYSSGCHVVKNRYNLGKHSVISCHNARRFHSARPRWWFLAVSHCNATDGLNLKYKFFMTNNDAGQFWTEHFSADEFYILPLLLLFFVLYLFLVVATISCSVELKSRRLFHFTYKIFMLSVFIQEFGIALQCVAYAKYALNGIGYPLIKYIGRIAESLSEMYFVYLLLLMAKGYTITRGRLSASSIVKLAVFMCVYSVTTSALFIFEQHIFDPGNVLYLYESPAGYALMALRIAAWWIFECSTLVTLKHYPEKSHFYYPFNLIGTLWFAAGPCFTLTANNLIDKWIRESIVCGVTHLIAILGHILFFLLTIPSKANKNFPYHVRTSQIGVMENEPTTNSCADFRHHTYEPYTIPMSLIQADTTHVCSPPDVPVDLFMIQQQPTSSQFRKTMDSINATIKERDRRLLRNNDASARENVSNQNSELRSNSELVESEKILPRTPAVDNSPARTVVHEDCFIAPAFRRKIA